MSESNLVRKIIKALKKEYPDDVFYKVHISPYQERGIPDIIGCHRGGFIAIEIKTPENSDGATKYQKRQIELIIRAGGKAGVATNLEETLKIIAGI